MLELPAAIASLKTILDLAKSAKDAQLAMKISREVAELQSKLIGVQQDALALLDENRKLRDEVRDLKAKLTESNGELCPRCGKRAYYLTLSQPDDTFGDLGVSKRIYECKECHFSEIKLAH